MSDVIAGEEVQKPRKKPQTPYNLRRSDLPDYADEEETAAALGVCVRTLRRWRADGKGPRPTLVGRRFLYKRSTTTAWLDSQEQPAP
jgi:hypothetical protein